MSDYLPNHQLHQYEEEIVYTGNQSDEILSDTNSDDPISPLDLTSSVEDLNIKEISCPSCPICLRNYNSGSRIINIINDCGHSVCATCLYNIDSCPICRVKITDTVINWAIHSEITKQPKRSNIHPFYEIMIDYKDEIEEIYLESIDQEESILNKDQLSLISKIKLRLKGINAKEELSLKMIDNLMIPKWLSYHLKLTFKKLEEYQNFLEKEKIRNLEILLPFCP